MIIPKNVVLPEKKDNIKGMVFHLFYPDLTTLIFFDSDLTMPICWGNKNVVKTNAVYKLDTITTHLTTTTKVWLFSYIMSEDGYRKKQTLHCNLGDIRKHLINY
jgi:hypothetical protein